ncbi:hypothetical protein FRC11_011335 [Ceratobasidium sp. 423]|nr:hypothetical protein FRC11_011335 [Ceratobasidium sp. 423]
MPLRDRIRKFKSNAKSRIFPTNKVEDTDVGIGQRPTTPVPDTAHGWSHLRTFLRVLEQATKPFSPLKDAVTGIIECVDIYEDVSHERKEYEELYNELEVLFQSLQIHFEGAPPTITTTVGALCMSVS